MVTLALIGLVGGLITGVSPCVLPMLPIIFFASGDREATPTTTSSADAAGAASAEGSGGVATLERRRSRARKRDLRPLVIIAGLVTSFSLVTLVGTTALAALGLPDSFLRWTGLVVLVAVGLGLIFPAVGHLIERPFYRLPKFQSQRGGGFVLGLGLGTLYVPCAGPVLAAITVAGATGDVGLGTIVLTIAFAVGAALPLLFFAAAGSNIRRRVNAYRTRARAFRIAGGVILIALAVGLAFNLPAVLQRALPNYTAGVEEKIAASKEVQGALAPFPDDENRGLTRCEPGADELASCGPAPALRGTGRWFNTDDADGFTLAQQRGKVVLIDFWAYSCINCQRDEPYISQWYGAYRDAGLQVVGVHSPEFAFEKSATNVREAIVREDISYPVVQDNALETYRAYLNQYWPAKYLVDAQGDVRAIKFGEGGYDTTEKLIRELLREADPDVELPEPVTDVADADTVVPAERRTPELLLSRFQRPGYRGSPALSRDTPSYRLNPQQPQDTYSLGGSWELRDQGYVSRGDSKIRLHFRAANVYNVLAGEGEVRLERPGHSDRVIEVSGSPNAYQLVEDSSSQDEVITMTYSKGVRAVTFSFG